MNHHPMPVRPCGQAGIARTPTPHMTSRFTLVHVYAPWRDGLDAVDTLTDPTVRACMPPHVPVPKPGPCPKKPGLPGVPKVARKKATAAPKAKPAAPTPTPPAAPTEALPGLAGLPRTPGKPETATVAARNTNPSHGLTSGPGQPTYPEQGRAMKGWRPELGPLPSHAYEHNCTNVILAWDMRMRGYDVQAAPAPLLDGKGVGYGRTMTQTDRLLADAYTGKDGEPHFRGFDRRNERTGMPARDRTFNDINKEIEHSWPDGAWGAVRVDRHVFNVMKVGGKARYIEAQAASVPTHVVTSKYMRRYKPLPGQFGVARLVRLDDLVPTDTIREAVKTKQETQALLDIKAPAGKDTP